VVILYYGVVVGSGSGRHSVRRGAEQRSNGDELWGVGSGWGDLAGWGAVWRWARPGSMI
jgi:hypothetical protein